MTNRVLLSVVLGLTACAGSVDGGAEEAAADDALTNGATTQRHPEVGRVKAGNWITCTATLIGAHTALTAAHCVLGANGPIAPASIHFELDSDDLRVVRIEFRRDPAVGEFAGRDVALLELDHNARGAQPAVIASRAPEEGEGLFLLGYGDTTEGAGTDGQRRIGLNAVEEVHDGWFEYDGATGLQANICHGDSGGPTFVTRGGVQQLIGVHSQGTCDKETTLLVWDGNYGKDARLDGTNRTFIESWARGDVRYVQ